MDVKTESQLLQNLEGAVEAHCPSWVRSVSCDVYRQGSGCVELRIYIHWYRDGVAGASHTKIDTPLCPAQFADALTEAIREANDNRIPGNVPLEFGSPLCRAISEAFTEAGSAPEPPLEYTFAIECAEEKEERAKRLLEEAQGYLEDGDEETFEIVSREAQVLIDLAANDRAWAQYQRGEGR